MALDHGLLASQLEDIGVFNASFDPKGRRRIDDVSDPELMQALIPKAREALAMVVAANPKARDGLTRTQRQEAG
jgi:hypothetical protein